VCEKKSLQRALAENKPGAQANLRLLLPGPKTARIEWIMNYVEHINSLLRPQKTRKELILDLFAGAGGLALGFEAAGFETFGLEMNEDCVATYSHNLIGRAEQRLLTVNTTYPKVDIIIGGPPCQPFSVRGLQDGLSDTRNGFPAFIAAIAKVQPELWMFENVRGLLYKNKFYLQEVLSHQIT
jgi:DNA (cytosine-5)-methyltransferase 1